MGETVFWSTLLGLQLIGGIVALCCLTRLAGVTRPSLFHAGLIVIGICAAAMAVAWALSAAAVSGPLTALVIAVCLPLLIFSGLLLFLKYSLRDAARMFLVLMGCAAAVGALELVAVRLAFPTYVVPTNAMAPTIKGRHFAGACAYCGGSTVVRIRERVDGPPEPAEPAICTKCLRTGPVKEVGASMQIGDHIFGNRLANAHRWDAVIFRFPLNPKQLYVMRLVGLPGEEVTIVDGSIFINGAKVAPPPEISQLTWTELPEAGNIPPDDETYGIRGRVLQLEDDQYFVLGDNSQSAYDSRYWGPLPVENVTGVAQGIYFPPRSWKMLQRH